MKAAIKIFLVASMFNCKWLTYLLEYEVLCIFYTENKFAFCITIFSMTVCINEQSDQL